MEEHPVVRGGGIGLFVAGGLAGAFVVIFLVYPPAPGWGSDEKWGDIATWVSSVMTFSAVVFALYIANRDRRDRVRDRAADQHDANFRAAISLQGTMANLVAIADFAVEKLWEYQGTERNQFFGGLDSDPVSVLNRAELIRIGALDGLAAGVTGEFARKVLSALAWCRETASLLDKAVVALDDPPGMHFLLAKNIPALIMSYRVLLASAQGAAAAIAELIGDELELAPDRPPGAAKR